MTRPLTAVRTCLIGSLLLVAIWAAVAEAGEIERQRELFRNAYVEVERGNWGVVDNLSQDDQNSLQSYILWPDLRATWLRARINSVPEAEITAFVQQYGTLKPARELRYRHALNFVRNDDLAGYLRIYEQFYQGQDIAKLDCLALQAEIEAGRHQRVEVRAIELWLTGESQVSECDPVFKYLGDRNLLSQVEYQKRFDLAIQARSFGLAKWLAKKIDQQHVETATNWQQAQANPEDFLRYDWKNSSDAILRKQLVYAAERLTYRDPEIAAALWKRTAKQFKFSESQKLQTARHIALWTARDNLPGAYKQLVQLPPAAANEEVLRWRARTSLRDANWQRLLIDIAAMEDAERNSEEWRYWQAIAQIETGQALTAIADLESLRLERSFYGFLAADKLSKEYALDHSSLAIDTVKLAELESRPEVLRARELFFVGQDSRGRSEWDAALRHLPDHEKLQAAILADRWGWHSRAIAAVASSGEYDDLSIRYPLPYMTSFEASSTQANIPPTWAYGIARSESLFMRDVRSHAGAIGLMQLMPATGREVAREIKIPYSGLTTLVNPESNIRLGTSYLGKMAARYGGNQVLATAAYNAGPHRVDGWLPENGSLDARVWIENIPFNETRKYVKRVLAAQTIFHWRMTGKVRRLSDELSLVEASLPQQVASR